MSDKKILVITGASKGIGCARNKQIMNDMNTCHDDCLFSALDVTNYNDVKLWVNNIIKMHGIPDIIVNNAAILYKGNLFENKDISEYRKIMNVNVLGCINVLHCFMPYLKESNKSIKILNMTSLAGLSGGPTFVDYSTSKYAIEGLTNALSKEMPNNILICAYDPGAVTTNMLADVFPDLSKDFAKQNNFIESDKWGQLNYDFIANKLNRKYHHGKHVLGVMAKESYITVNTEQEMESYLMNYNDPCQSKL